MRYKFQLIFLFLFMMGFLRAQEINKKDLLTSVFADIQGQKITLELIEKEFPKLSIEAGIALMEFNRSYGIAISAVTDEIKKMYAERYLAFLSDLHTETYTHLQKKGLSEEIAKKIISNTKRRAHGQMRPDMLKVLLSYQYKDNPLDEYLERFYKIYSVSSYSNGEKLELSVEIPISWKEFEGDDATVLKQFRSEFGLGDDKITISYRKLTTQEIERYKSMSVHFFSKKELEGMVPKSQQLFQADNVRKGKQVGLIEYEDTGIMKTGHTVSYLFVNHNYLVLVKCSSYATMVSGARQQFKKSAPLFQAIANGLLLGKKENRLLTSKL